MAQDSSFDLIIIGGGPAGYVGAIRASQLGLKVACVEREKLGGVCLNWGCIPTKALLNQAHFYRRLKEDGEALGVKADNISHDWSTVIERSRKVSGTLNKGIGGLFKKNKITHVEGHAFVADNDRVEIYDTPAMEGDPRQTLTANNVMIATGAGPRELPFAPFDGERILSYREAMVLDEQPEKLVIVGAGVIGLEFADFFNCYGTEVTVIEMQDQVLPGTDPEVAKEVHKRLKRAGIDFHLGAATSDIEASDSGVTVTIGGNDDDAETQTFEGDRCLVAIGVVGKYDGLFDENLGLRTENHHIKVNRKDYQTSRPGIFAVGDVIGAPWLAHVASEEAIVCVEKIAGEDPEPIDYDNIPGCVYCHPQVASVGKTEAELEEDGVAFNVGKFPFQASGKAQAEGDTAGFVKILSGEKYGEILGAHLVGDNVTELIHEIVVARRLESTTEELITTIHAHPTLSEAVHEAALGTEGRMIHF
ncbi:MAG: dihydrolipoyl dehydrogenase [Phycisphaeraceae bacterium]|nr:dihydrolipoyl dehydrogenase [Phycisphaeraceae bacterium]